MVYLEYEAYKRKFLDVLINYNDILTEKENLFNKTQSIAIRYDRENVQHSVGDSGFDKYLVEKEAKRIDERLDEARQLLDDREKILKLKEVELRASTDKPDQIYCMRFLDYKRPHEMAKILNYSVSQIYRILDKIQKNMRNMK